MSPQVETEERAPESKQPSVSERGDPPEKQTAIENIVGMLPEFGPAFVGRLADRLKEELNVQPPTEPPTGCDEIPTLAECKRIKALYPKIDLNHETSGTACTMPSMKRSASTGGPASLMLPSSSSDGRRARAATPQRHRGSNRWPPTSATSVSA